MLCTITCRVIASILAFLVGCAAFEIARPTEELRLPEPKSQIVSISLQRRGCSDAERKCPVFDATFRSDGTCTFVGYANDEFLGKYEAEYGLEDFAYLVEQVERQGFFELPLVMSTGPAEETVAVEVVTSEGAKRVTTQNWASTPSGLRALQAVIEQETYEVDWEEGP
ncbi:MAG TPA: DUF6438 domain-containing protein [Pyrinomonadaceae bacterium]|nr:DUF6438 domain-containing protein [Pyrinomonadaceae bacterium]